MTIEKETFDIVKAREVVQLTIEKETFDIVKAREVVQLTINNNYSTAPNIDERLDAKLDVPTNDDWAMFEIIIFS